MQNLVKHLFTICLATLLSVACYGQKVKLALKLIKGNTYNMVTVTNSSVRQTISGQANNMDMTITGSIAFKVLNATDTLYSMAVTYKALSLKMQLPTGAVAFDSQKKDSSDVMSSVLTALTNKPFKITITSSGKVRSVENIENMISSAIDSFHQIRDAQKDQLKAQFVQSFGSSAIKGNIEMATAIFPEGTVSKNDKWTISTKLNGAVSARLTSVYQLVNETPANNIIHGEATIATDPKAGYREMNGLPMKYNMQGKMVSDIKTDKTTGWITESNITQDISGTVDIKDNPKVPGGITFPMSMTNKSVTTDK